MKESYLKSVSKSGLFRYLPEEKYSRIWNELAMAPRTYQQGQIIYSQDQIIERAAIVHSGRVRGELIDSEGNAHVMYFYNHGEIFAFEGAVSRKKSSPINLVADDETIVLFFDVNKITVCSASEEIITGLFELLANSDIKKLYRIEILSHKSLRERIMLYLNIVASTKGSRSLDLEMSRQQLADYLCVNRSALSNELNLLKKEGVIELDGKKVTLLI